MSQISAIFGTDDDSEIMQSLYLIANVSGHTFINGRHNTLLSLSSTASTGPWHGLTALAQNTHGLGLIHESINIYDSTYTRPWFAWANSYFAEMLLDLAQRKPHLIFKDGKPYTPGQ